MTYSHLSGYTYKIKLTTCTDASLGSHCQETITINGASLISDRVNGTISLCSPAHDGVIIGANISYNEYYFTYTFPGTGSYYLEFDGVNRNSGIVNMSNSSNQDIYLRIPLTISSFFGLNSQPTCSLLLMDFSCLNNGCLYYNPSAFDADGDSLAFSILPCENNSGITSVGYSFPVGTFSVNSSTGIITWCTPQSDGYFSVLLKIEEWRNVSGNYILLSYTLRDIQFQVSSCVGIDELNSINSDISINPTPTTSSAQLFIKNNTDEHYSFEILDITGKKTDCIVSTENTTQLNAFTLHLENVDAGMYFIKITGNKGTNIIKKIIKN